MQLMAQHKYGLRVKNEVFFQNLINSLGKAAVTIDLLEVKPSAAVTLNMSGCSTGRSKGERNETEKRIALLIMNEIFVQHRMC